MNVVIAVTKACNHCGELKKELEKIGIAYTVKYFEEHPELLVKFKIKHSPLIIVDGEVVFNGMPPISALQEYFNNKKRLYNQPS